MISVDCGCVDKTAWLIDMESCNVIVPEGTCHASCVVNLTFKCNARVTALVAYCVTASMIFLISLHGCHINFNLCIYKLAYKSWSLLRAQSAIRKMIAPRVGFWVDRHVGPKFTVRIWCHFCAILSSTVVTLSASCSVAVSYVNKWELNQSAIDVSNEVILWLRLDDCNSQIKFESLKRIMHSVCSNQNCFGILDGTHWLICRKLDWILTCWS